METRGVKERLLSIIANIEERTDSELIEIVKETLMAVGTGTPINDVNEQYKFVYQTLDQRLNDSSLQHSNQFDDLWSFYSYWKDNGLNTYASRRAYVRNLYKVDSNQKDEHVFWSLINPVIKAIAKPRFDNEQYADAVEAVFKEINSRVKEVYRQKTGEYEDGAKLMNKAFSPNNPIIVLDDLETEDGSNIQNGYMQMFAGAMTGIRNPKAHSNHDTTSDEAIPLIQIASHLFTIFEQAMQNVSETISESSIKNENDPALFLRLEDPNDHDKLINMKNLISTSPGNTKVILVLGREKKSAIRLPMGVDISNKKFINLIKGLFGEDNVVVKKS